MRHLLPKPRRLTVGERALVWAYLTVSMFGVAFGLIVVLRLDPAAFFSRGMTVYEYWILVSGALGVCLALRISREKFGLPGLRDTLVGMVMVTFVAPIIAGTLALPLYGTMFGPMTLAIIFYVAPVTAALWFTSLTGVHFMLRRWQVERNSIFGAPEPSKRPGLLGDILRDFQIR